MTIATGYVKPRCARKGWRMDAALVLLGAMAVLMLTGVGGSLAIFALISVIGIPIGVLFFASVPSMAALLPMRLAYPFLRRRLPWIICLPLTLAIGAGAFFTIDTTLKRAPDGTHAAQSLIAQDSPLLTAPIPDNGVIGIFASAQDISCRGACLTLLQTGQVRAVIMMSGPTTPALRFTSLQSDASCASGTTLADSGQSCVEPATNALPMLTFQLERQTVPADMPDIRALWAITVRSGAMSQTVSLVDAVVPQGGGLLAPNTGGTMGEDVSYLPRMTRKSFAVFDTRPAITSTRRNLPDGFEAAILHVVAAG